MKDYLELLLARRQEEDEETLTLAVREPEELPVRRSTRSAAPREPEAAEGLPESGPAGLTGPAAPEAVAVSGPGPVTPGSAAVAGSGPRRLSAGWVLLEEQLERAADALDRVRGNTGDAPAPEGEAVRFSRAPEESAGRTGRRPGDLDAGAAGLARRLARTALASAPPPVPDLSGGMVQDAPASDGWAEFDRRLERDARRYDGGMGMY